jgi:preprotein translocase subunit YajC
MTTITASLLVLAAGPGGNLAPFLLQVGLIFAIFYFLLIRPQSQQRKKHEEALRNLKKGDPIVTTGGIIGEVVHIKEATKDGAAVKSMDDAVTIRSGESRLVVERGRIAKILASSTTAQTTA